VIGTNAAGNVDDLQTSAIQAVGSEGRICPRRFARRPSVHRLAANGPKARYLFKPTLSCQWHGFASVDPAAGTSTSDRVLVQPPFSSSAFDHGFGILVLPGP
jgi:hypothetical protein